MRMMILQVDHEAVKLNMDFLHLWEAGDVPQTLKGEIGLFKN